MAGEFDLISKYFAPLAAEQGLNLKDDAACFTSKAGFDTVVTKDLIVEGTHFRSADDVRTVGYKALAVNVSDCIAKAATPSLYWLGISVPKNTPEKWFASLASGLGKAQEAFNCKLAGGDTTAHAGQGVTISITLMGQVPSGRMVKRSTASVGDDLYVTGTLGDSALGLTCLANNIDGYAALKEHYTMPEPPMGIEELLLEHATASADISDGLIADGGRICDASSLGCIVFENKLPISEHVKDFVEAFPDQKPQIWSGGDDYQTIFTAHKDLRSNIAKLADDLSISISRIGYMKAGASIHLLDMNKENLQITRQGYRHF